MFVGIVFLHAPRVRSFAPPLMNCGEGTLNVLLLSGSSSELIGTRVAEIVMLALQICAVEHFYVEVMLGLGLELSRILRS